MSESLIKTYLEKIAKFGHDPKYLSFMSNLLVDRKQPIKENRNKVLNVLFNSNLKLEFFFLHENEFYNDDESEYDEEYDDEQIDEEYYD